MFFQQKAMKTYKYSKLPSAALFSKPDFKKNSPA
jgi:hypothetical protein